MSSKKRVIAIVSAGDTDITAAKVIAAHIIGYMNLGAEIVQPIEHPAYAYDEIRFQYNAGTILKTFDTLPFDGFDKIIGVMNVDLFVPILTYVFGEARQGGRCALVSLFRLKQESKATIPPPSLVYERIAKVALHELGHLFNLFHCEDHHCLMHFSGGVCQLDETPLYFCRYCTSFLNHALKEDNHLLRKVSTS